MNTKMKMLSLALIGAFGYAGVAAADCPTDPVPPWSAKSTIAGSVEIASPGLDGSECRMDAAITANLGSATAFVRDDSPAGESRYRAQFLVNLDDLAGQNVAQPVRIFAANTESPSNGVSELVKLTVYGNAAGTARVLGISTACASTSTFRCASSAALNSSGVNQIEMDWVSGGDGDGYLKVWVNGSDEATHTVKIDVDNSAWGGVDFATLGLATPSAAYRTAQLDSTVQFDTFDSRRQTFIGN